MTKPRETLWDADPHTIAKHRILRGYLEAWFPILASVHGRIVYYDGFAGPGRYRRGEEGSPLIALSVARDHRADLDSELVFVFVEERKDRADYLQSELDCLSIPDNFVHEVKNEGFAPALGATLDELDKRGLTIAPTFAFIDPFGIKGLPFRLVARLLARKRCEVLITFMTHAIQRFVTELPEHVDDLVGVRGAAARIATASNRVLESRKIYEESL